MRAMSKNNNILGNYILAAANIRIQKAKELLSSVSVWVSDGTMSTHNEFLLIIPLGAAVKDLTRSEAEEMMPCKSPMDTNCRIDIFDRKINTLKEAMRNITEQKMEEINSFLNFR